MKMDPQQRPFSSLNELAALDAGQRTGQSKRIETSGLLDLRTLTRGYGSPNQSSLEQQAIPEPMNVAAGTPPGMLVPVFPLEPPTLTGSGSNKLLWAMGGVAALLAVAAAALVAMVVTRSPRDATTAAAPAPVSAPVATTPAPVATKPVAAPPAATPPATTPPAAAPALIAQTDRDEVKNDSRAQARPARATTERVERRQPERDRNAVNTRPAVEAKKDPPAPAEPSCMDEIACELAPNPPACCSRYKSQRNGSASLLDEGERLPERLDREAIAAGMKSVVGTVSSCRAGARVSGTVKISVKVAGSGEVTRVEVKETPDPRLGECVAGKVQKARFTRTQKGAAFSYPFIF